MEKIDKEDWGAIVAFSCLVLLFAAAVIGMVLKYGHQ